MKILNLYAGIGGNRKLWGDEHEITAVEYKPGIAAIYKDLFPNDTVIVDDAHKYLLEHYKEFDFIWSSPPCPTHSRARFGLGVHGGKVKAVYPDMKLYQEIILLKHHFEGKWCIENVQAYYTPLIAPTSIGRHWYWSNFYIPNDIDVEPSGITETKRIRPTSIKRSKAGDFEERYGYDLSKYGGVDKRLVMINAVEPEIGKYILYHAINPYEINARLFV